MVTKTKSCPATPDQNHQNQLMPEKPSEKPAIEDTIEDVLDVAMCGNRAARVAALVLLDDELGGIIDLMEKIVSGQVVE